MSASEDRHDRSLLALIAACSALGPMANNLLLPALPQVQQSLAISVPAAQSAISAYLIAFAVGILLVGPLSDRFGRRRVIACGLAIFTTGCLVCALSPNLTWLVCGRVVQAVGASAGLTVARASAGDRYRGAELAQALAVITMAMMVGTTVSPIVGAYLAKWFGWQMGFWVMATLAASVLAWMWWQMPETRRAGTRGESARDLLREMGAVLKNPRFVGYALQGGLVYSLFLAFISVAPYVMQHALGSELTDFGLYYMLLSAGYFLGNLFVATWGRGLHPEQLMYAGLGLQLVCAAIGLLLALAGVWTPLALFLPQLPLAFGQGLALPHITAKGVQLVPQYPGVAASMMGFSQQAMAAVSVQFMGLAATDTPVPISWFCLACGAIAMLAVLWLTPWKRVGQLT